MPNKYTIDINVVDKLRYTAGSKTKPNNNDGDNVKPDKGSTPFEDTDGKSGGGSNTINSILKLMSGNKSTALNQLSSLGKGFATFVAIIKLGEASYETAMKVLNYIEPFYTTSTGNYNFAVDLKNFQNIVNKITHPISSALALGHIYNQNRIDNLSKEQSRDLLGDSIINDFTRGV